MKSCLNYLNERSSLNRDSTVPDLVNTKWSGNFMTKKSYDSSTLMPTLLKQTSCFFVSLYWTIQSVKKAWSLWQYWKTWRNCLQNIFWNTTMQILFRNLHSMWGDNFRGAVFDITKNLEDFCLAFCFPLVLVNMV